MGMCSRFRYQHCCSCSVVCQIAPEIRDQIKWDHHYHGLAAIGAETYEGLNIYINEAPQHELTKEELDQDGLG